jgi:putative glutamine amidotransferase
MHDVVVKYNNYDYITMIFPQDVTMSFRKDTFIVNSWHHQGLKDIAEGIKVIAESYDGLPEAVVMDKQKHPFMIAVQFHPERLGENNVIHKNMRARFFDAISE